MTHPSRSNESANKHSKLHNGIYREFLFALTGHILGLTWEFFFVLGQLYLPELKNSSILHRREVADFGYYTV